MNTHFGLTKVAVLAAAPIILLATFQSAAAQSGGGDSQAVPYADTQRDRDTDYRTPPPPPPPPPAAPPAISYAPTSDSRYAPQSDPASYRTPQCRLIEDRAYYPDGTTESRSVQACRGPSGRWHVVD